jgi:hypothetical protein
MTTTDTTQYHPTISSPNLGPGLERLAARERTCRADAERVAERALDLERADASGDPHARERAAERLAGAHELLARSSHPTPDADALQTIRAALADGMHYCSVRSEFEPVADPRDNKPKRLHPGDQATLEGQLRLRATLGDLRRRADAWHHDPASVDSAAIVALLGDLSAACRDADAFRALVSAPLSAVPNPESR